MSCTECRYLSGIRAGPRKQAVESAPSNALVANGATPEQDGFWRAREVYAFVGDAEVMGKASHVPLGRWQGPRDDGQWWTWVDERARGECAFPIWPHLYLPKMEAAVTRQSPRAQG